MKLMGRYRVLHDRRYFLDRRRVYMRLPSACFHVDVKNRGSAVLDQLIVSTIGLFARVGPVESQRVALCWAR